MELLINAGADFHAPLAEDAPPVIKKIHKKGAEPDPLRGCLQ